MRKCPIITGFPETLRSSSFNLIHMQICTDIYLDTYTQVYIIDGCVNNMCIQFQVFFSGKFYLYLIVTNFVMKFIFYS